MGTKKNVDSVANAKENTSEDMDATDLADELQTLSDMLPKEMSTCLLVLEHIFFFRKNCTCISKRDCCTKNFLENASFSSLSRTKFL
jgi:hypothetical protein